MKRRSWTRPSSSSLADRAVIPVETDVPGIRLPASIEASLYFFCSEALTNIAKHAQAARAWIRLEVAADRCVLEVADDELACVPAEGFLQSAPFSGVTRLR